MIRIAEHAGFCFGVKRATDKIEELLRTKEQSSSIYTLGELIHNPTYVASLIERGIQSVDLEQVPSLAERSSRDHSVTLVVRTHGIPKETQVLLKRLEEQYPHFSVLDMTCPFVRRIQRIASEQTVDCTPFLLLGSHGHPEVTSILSHAHGKAVALPTSDELVAYIGETQTADSRIIVAAQTTQSREEWKNTKKILKKLYTNSIFFDTICDVTEKRQVEAASLASRSDAMIVIGGRTSANTAQLFSVCSALCPKTFWIESANEVDGLPKLSGKISITAGASTPVDIILEVYNRMNTESMNFEEMLDESLKSLHTGDVVTGIVTEISDLGIYLDLGTKVTGYIAAEQVSDDPTIKLREMFKIGDEVKAFVIRVNDGEGMATLSKKRVDQDQNWFKLVEAYESGAILEGQIAAAVKGGVIITLADQKAFIPASHSTVPRDVELSTIVGTTQKVKIIDIDESRHRALASIRVARNESRKAEQTALWSSLSVGQQIRGTVKNLATYGAFVDIGGIDGMVHNTELSWKRIKHPSQVVSVGDEIDVYIKEIDLEKRRISLGYKTEAMDTWSAFVGGHQVGDVVPAKITSMMPFGAFAEVYDGVEGLIHISRISMEKIAKPEDVLTLGQEVNVKITDIDNENRKLSLSIRALLEEAAREEEAARRQAEKDAADKEYAEEQARLAEERAEMAPYIVGSID